jgi:hypothetical protein
MPVQVIDESQIEFTPECYVSLEELIAMINGNRRTTAQNRQQVINASQVRTSNSDAALP